ncbi:hypothetical protein [uncultured Ottowia sp.]|uniref:hypothetical protein n=1 Tax=uncultured Ottowia sp. TaxID=543067 RepID=UPI002591EC28|nr:hypothetical protein [uncultured Ottowia sp.]
MSDEWEIARKHFSAGACADKLAQRQGMVNAQATGCHWRAVPCVTIIDFSLKRKGDGAAVMRTRRSKKSKGASAALLQTCRDRD